jgi:hypothetical protein
MALITLLLDTVLSLLHLGTATVRAPALAQLHCNASSFRVNYSEPISQHDIDYLENSNEPVLDMYPSPPSRLVYLSMFVTLLDERERLVHRFGVAATSGTWTPGQACIGDYTVTDCEYVSAIAEYNITIQDTNITLNGDIAHPKIVALANNTGHAIDSLNLASAETANATWSTLAGIEQAADSSFNTFYCLAPGNPYPIQKESGPGIFPWTQECISTLEQTQNSEICFPNF